MSANSNSLHVVSVFDDPEPATARERTGGGALIYCKIFDSGVPGWDPENGFISASMPWDFINGHVNSFVLNLAQRSTVAFFYTITLFCSGDETGDIQLATRPVISPLPPAPPTATVNYSSTTSSVHGTMSEYISQSNNCVFTRDAGQVQISLEFNLTANGNFFNVSTTGHFTAIVGDDTGEDCFNAFIDS